MMDFFPHPTDPNLVVLRATTRYIGKHSDEDLQAAVLAEREACAVLVEGGNHVHPKAPDAIWAKTVAKLIRARGKK